MEKSIKLLCISMILFLSGCTDYLDVVPDDVATIDHAFVDRVSAESFLATIYSYMPNIGNPQSDPAVSATDELGVVRNSWNLASFQYYGDRIKYGEQNSNTPYMDYWVGSNYGRGIFIALRDCNIFLENIHKVGPDLNQGDRERWIAEVKFFKAFYHYYLLRMYGPIPLIRENLPISADIDEVKLYRDPFDEGIEYVVELCDEAMVDLPLTIINTANELGRITKPIAATLKAEALVMVASPLFNGNSDYMYVTDNRGVKLFSQTEDNSKWEKAAIACKEAIDICHQAEIRLYTFSDSRYTLSDTTRRGMSIRGAATEKWNEELIWGNPVNTSHTYQRLSLPYMKTEDKLGSGPDPEMYANFKMTDLFYSNNGVPIEEDISYNYADRFSLTTVGDDHYYYIPEGAVTASINTYREPRFYASMGFDKGYWFGNGRSKDVGKGESSETPYIIAAKQGEMSGKGGDIRYSRSGYFLKKIINFETATSSSGSLNVVRTTYPIMRLADLYLLYAEALNESREAPNSEVYYYIDLVRERAGLEGVRASWSKYSRIPDKPTTKTGMRDIIRQERMIELCFEGKRYWDIRRWKQSHVYYNQPERGWNVDQNRTEDYYTVIVHGQLEFTTKQYLWPISESELRRNINLVQNPYWD